MVRCWAIRTSSASGAALLAFVGDAELLALFREDGADLDHWSARMPYTMASSRSLLLRMVVRPRSFVAASVAVELEMEYPPGCVRPPASPSGAPVRTSGMRGCDTSPGP